MAAIRGPHLPAPADAEADELVKKIAAGPSPRLFAGLKTEASTSAISSSVSPS